MKGALVILDHVKECEAAALVIDGVLEDLLVDLNDGPRPGAIFRGICDRPIKGQGGMMLRLSGGLTGFLRQGKGLRPGQAVLVQMTGYATEGKAIPVTDRLLFKSRYAIVTPDRPGVNVSRQIADDDLRDALRAIAHARVSDTCGVILRSACADAAEDNIAADIDAMTELANTVLSDAAGEEAALLIDGDSPHLLAWREWTQPATVETSPGGFESRGVLDQIVHISAPGMRLGAGHMYVEPTRAFCAVDINSGGDTSPAAALKVNLAACRALPRALRLRGIGGQIVVDFVSMSKAHRRQVEQALRAAFKADPIETSLIGWTTMGLFELQRKRERWPVPAHFYEDL